MKEILVPSRKLVVPLTVSLRGEFKIEAIRPDGQRRILVDWFPNLITDIGLDRLGSAADFLSFCRVGTGTAAPNFADTQLAAQVASTSTIVASSDSAAGSAPYLVDAVRTYQFSAGAAAGNLAEVGIGWSGSGASLFSRARILDTSGNPTTITVLSDEFLNVSYRLRQFAPAADRLGQFSIGSGVYDYTARAALVTAWEAIATVITNAGANSVSAYSGAIGAVTGQPSSSLGFGTTSWLAYSAGTYYRDASCVFSPSQANGTHRSYLLNASGRGIFQFEISPTIVKSNLDQLTITFRVGWQRIVGTG